MSATAYTLHDLSIQYDPGIAITRPPPCGGSADWVHDRLLEDLGQGTTPYIGGSKSEGIYRTSLYSYTVPLVRRGLVFQSAALLSGLSAHSGLPHNVPSQSLV